MSKILTTKELAEYIKLNEKTIIKMAQEGKLPGKKISNKWRFHIDAIDDYFFEDVVKMPDPDLDTIIRTTEFPYPLSRLTAKDLIRVNLKLHDKSELFENLVDIAVSGNVLNKKKKRRFYELILERENILSTAVNDIVAIPHPRNPEEGMFSSPNIIIATTREGIPYDNEDKKPKLFFLICATNEFVHLRLLAKITKLIHNIGAVNMILGAETPDDVMQALLKHEKDMIADGGSYGA